MRKNVQALLSSFKAEMHTHVENINNLIISCDIFLCVWPRGQKPSSNWFKVFRGKYNTLSPEVGEKVLLEQHTVYVTRVQLCFPIRLN